jgi:hypothetical protein
MILNDRMKISEVKVSEVIANICKPSVIVGNFNDPP